MHRNLFFFDYDLACTEIYFMCETYVIPQWKPPDPKILALPPPKRFLKEGSRFHTSPDTVYWMEGDRSSRKEHCCHANVYKFRDDKPGKIQLIQCTYYFDRRNNMMKQMKGTLKIYTYIPAKRALYIITNEPTGYNSALKPKKYVKRTRRVSLNYLHLAGLQNFPRDYVTRWVNAIYKTVKRDVPDVCAENKDLSRRVIELVIQHRVGKSIPGLSSNLMSNLANVVTQAFSVQIASKNFPNIPMYNGNGNVSQINPVILAEALRIKKKTVYKFLPVLKKTGSTKKAFKVLFGKYYFNTLRKLMEQIRFSASCDEMVEFITRYNDDVPTSLKHMINHHLDIDSNETERLVNRVVVPTSRTMWLVNSIISMLKDKDNTLPHVINNWTRTMMRLKIDIAWRTWRDMYDMSVTLGRRVRPARFKAIEDVNALHDRYNNMIAAMNVPIAGIALELLVFLKADVPMTLPNCKYLFVQLLTPTELEQESQVMGHCVRGYSNSCASGASIIVAVRDEDGEAVWTLEYAGSNFKYLHGQGVSGDEHRPAPSEYELTEFIYPLGKEIAKREGKKSLSFVIRAKMILHLQKMWADVDRLEYFSGMKCVVTVDEEDGDVFERCNRNIERLLVIHQMIEQNAHPGLIVDKITELEQESEEDALDLTGIPVGDPLPPAPAVADNLETADFEMAASTPEPFATTMVDEQHFPF